MKKLIGILGVAVIAVTMFANTNSANINKNTDLASLIAMNVANAEDEDGDLCSSEPDITCWVSYPDGSIFFSPNCEPDTFWTWSDCM